MGQIIVLVAGNERGGAASHILTYAKAAEHSGALKRVQFVLLGQGYLSERLLALVGVSRCTVVPSQFRGAVSALRKLVQTVARPIVHAHGPRLNLVARVALGRKVAWTSTIHSHIFNDYTASRWKSMVLPRVNRWALQATVGLFVVNPQYAGFLPGKKSILVPNSIQVDPLPNPRLHYQTALRNRLDIPMKSAVFGMAARFDPIKDIPTLLKALRIMNREDVHVAIAGDGAGRQVIEELIAHLGLNHRVHLLGFLDNIREFYAGLTAHVLPSKSEGMPSSVLEAGSVGIPNIGSDIEGITRLITDGETGLCFQVGDEKALSQQMLRLLDDPDLAQRLASRFLAEVLPNYTPETMLNTYMQGYAQLMPWPTDAEDDTRPGETSNHS